MHSVQLYIHETLDTPRLGKVKAKLMGLPHVVDVELNATNPHEVVVDYDERQGMPMKILEMLENEGLHPDIVSA